MRRARRLAELRKLRVQRKSAVIVQAFIEWGHPDLDQVRSALLHELKKGRAQFAHHRTTHMVNADYGELSAVQQRSIRAQLGRLDSRFVDTQFQQSNDFYATIAHLAETGGGNARRQQELLQGAFERMVPEFGQLLSGTPISSFHQSLSGLIGSPDEIANSGVEAIKNISDRELRIARTMTRRIGRKQREAGEMIASSKLSPAVSELLKMQNSTLPQTTAGQWAVIQLVQCALLISRGGEIPDLSQISLSF
jgi:hypothetical protein